MFPDDEEANKLLGYIAMTSRKRNDPISVQILSSSGAGKTALQDAVTGADIRPVLGERRPGDPSRLVADRTLAGQTLGWQPPLSPRQALPPRE